MNFLDLDYEAKRLLIIYFMLLLLYLAWKESHAKDRMARELSEQTRVMKANSEHYPDPTWGATPRVPPGETGVSASRSTQESEDDSSED